MKETVVIKGNLHLRGVISEMVLNIVENCFDNGIELSYYHCSEMPTENLVMNYGKFLEDFKNKIVEVDGEVTGSGDAETLEEIKGIDVRVDVSDIKNDSSFKVEIKKPTGVKSVSTNYITVSLEITDASSDFIISLLFSDIPSNEISGT